MFICLMSLLHFHSPRVLKGIDSKNDAYRYDKKIIYKILFGSVKNQKKHVVLIGEFEVLFENDLYIILK